MEEKICQSCGMELNDDNAGTEANGGKSEDYCNKCYKDGKFIDACSMGEFLDKHMAMYVAHCQGMAEGQVKSVMQSFLITLKRWKS